MGFPGVPSKRGEYFPKEPISRTPDSDEAPQVLSLPPKNPFSASSQGPPWFTWLLNFNP